MTWPDPRAMQLFLFAVLIAATGLLLGVSRTHRDARHATTRQMFTLGFTSWMAGWAALGFSGIAQDIELPFAVFGGLFLVNLIAAVALGASGIGRRLAEGLPISLLVGFHGFRLPLELALHRFAEQGSVPMAMSWGGQNFDVVTGVLALLLAPFVKRVPALVWGFQIVGTIALLNIFRIVMIHTPGSPLYSESIEQPVLLIAYAPFNWIGSVGVVAAVLGHIVVGRWLWQHHGKRPA